MEHPPIPPSPAVDFLTALQRGSGDAAGKVLSSYVILTVPQLQRRFDGATEVLAEWQRAREMFPDLSYRPHTRHVGKDVVIDQGTVEGTQTGGDKPTGLALSTDVRVTVTHDGTTVQAVTADVDLPPLMTALGRPVDRYAMAVSQVQALRTLHRPDMVTYRLEEPPTRAALAVSSPTHAGRRRSSRRFPTPVKVVTVVLALFLVAGGAWGFARDDGSTPAAAESKPAAEPTSSAPSSRAPSPTATPTRRLPPPSKKPEVVLGSDLAFGFDSARVSGKAREAVVRLAEQARSAGLAGTILVEGYTDSLGSARHGKRLSQRRADAVASILRARLDGTSLTVLARGLGEADPIGNNSTAAGRAKNRRVTITLPSP